MTISDIAKEAGVSRATVSGVLNDNPHVAEKTREKVLAIIEKYNFSPNQIARALALRQTGLVGLIVKDISNPLYSKISLGVEEVCEEAGYNVVMGNTHTETERELEYLNLLKRHRVDGLLILPLQRDTKLPAFQELLEAQLPIVLLGDLPDIDADLVRSDDESGAYHAASHLIQNGRRRLMYISGPESFYASARRLKGFKRAMQENNVEFDEQNVIYSGWRFNDGYATGQELCRSRSLLDAGLFCYNDSVAIGLMRALFENGYKIPDDLEIIGFDDAGVGKYLQTSLTTVAQPAREIGRRAAQLLLEKINFKGENWQSKKIFLETTLVIRETS